MNLSCQTGLASRVCCIANGLALFPEIRFLWQINAHLPCAWPAIFPNGIPGVEFVTCDDGNTLWDHSNFWLWSPTARFDLVIPHLAGRSRGMFQHAVLARFFRNPSSSIPRLVDSIVARRPVSLFLLADSRRAEITSALVSHGIPVVLPHSPELRHDLDRSPADVLLFISDWLTLLSAETVFTTSPKSALLYPRRQR